MPLDFFSMQNESVPILSAPAHLYDGDRQLPGTLELWPQQLVFRFANFRESHLNLFIQLDSIKKVEEFLIYNVARNGLRISCKDGKTDLFVLEESQPFKATLDNQLKECLPDNK